MKKLNQIIILLLFFSNAILCQNKKNENLINSQNGYSINIDTKNLAKEKLLLYFNYGITNQMVISDSVTIKTNNQKVIFKMSQKVIGLVYKLKLASDSKFIELAVDNNSKINLELDNKNIENIKCTLSNENKDFIDYQASIKSIDNDKKQVLRNNILKKYPNSVLSLYLKIENKINEVQPENTDSKIKYRNSFFSFIDKNDKRIIFIPNIYRLLYSYINILPINNDNYIQNIDLLLKNIDCKSTAYQAYTKWILSNLKYYESQNLENTFTYFYKKYINDVPCDILTNTEKNNEKNNFITSKKLPNGSIIPDFTMVDSNLKEYKLSAIYSQNEFTFLAFFSPSCHHCQQTIPEVQKFFSQISTLYGTHKIQIVSVLNDADETLWSKFIADNKLENWINLKNTDPTKKYQENFNAHANPDFFLIDSNGKIIIKSYNPLALSQIFKRVFN